MYVLSMQFRTNQVMLYTCTNQVNSLQLFLPCLFISRFEDDLEASTNNVRW